MCLPRRQSQQLASISDRDAAWLRQFIPSCLLRSPRTSISSARCGERFVAHITADLRSTPRTERAYRTSPDRGFMRALSELLRFVCWAYRRTLTGSVPIDRCFADSEELALAGFFAG